MTSLALDRVFGPFQTELDPDRINEFRNVVGMPPSGEVPATFLAMSAWAVQWDAFGLIPSEVMNAAGARVHGEHEIRLHDVLIPGETLITHSQLIGVRPNRAGSVVVQRIDHHRGDLLVAQQWWSLFLGGVQLDAVGDIAPDHVFPEASRNALFGTHSVHVSDATATAYAEVSGDWAEHHFDADAAARSGAAGPFLHGLCTFAICAHAAAEGRSIKRVAARFAAPALLGNDINVDIYGISEHARAFEATCAGAKVATNGVVEFD